MSNKVYVSWEMVEIFVNKLYEKYEDKCFSGVYGLPRGGLIPAIMISHKFKIPLLMAPTNNCLIVDDIADSGKSLSHFTENDTNFCKYTIATMYHHKRSEVTPNFYIWDKQDNWIVFPWEMEKC